MSKDPKRIFGETVRKLRTKAGWSQEELAAASALHRTYIGGVERGERNVGLLNIVELARALGVKPATLLENIL
jgi:transcriptional regulator with XRE-family HTH domain